MIGRQMLAFAAVALALQAGAAAQDESSRALKVTAGPGQSPRPLGLRAQFDRPDPVYAVGEPLGLMIAADQEASIEIWDFGPDGSLTRLLPNIYLSAGPDRPLRLPMRGQRFEVGGALGISELHVIARAVAPERAAVRADSRRPGSDKRQEVRLRYRVVAR